LNSFDHQSFLADFSSEYRLFNKERINALERVDLGPLPAKLQRTSVRFNFSDVGEEIVVYAYGKIFNFPEEHRQILKKIFLQSEVQSDELVKQFGFKVTENVTEKLRRLRLYV
jgi:hypothetical protein